MKANSTLYVFVVLCSLLVIHSVEQKKPALLKIEEGDGGSGDPVRKLIGPDDTEVSSGEPDCGDDEDCNDNGSGSGDDGSGSGDSATTNSPKTTQTVVVINAGDKDGSSAVTTTVAGITTIKSTEMDNNVDPSWNNNRNQSITIDNDIPDTGASATMQDAEAGSSGVNFTVAIIVGVVVGAILSILIIVFLVYRLRKKDEGSYSLDEQSSAMLRADTDSPPPKGKDEYYA